MAMAEVFLPEMVSTAAEDLSISFPRAPPPSPEMQPRGHGRVFEIPASKFEGIGLDLRRDTFPLDEDEEDGEEGKYPVRLRKPFGSSVPFDDSSMMFSGDSIHEDDFIICSPRKRVCCATGITVPSDHMITTFPSSCDTNSLASSGFGSSHDIIRREEAEASFNMGFTNGTGADSMLPTLPTLFSSGPRIQSKPHLIPPRIEGEREITRDPVTSTSPFSPSYFIEDNHQYNLLSRSCDLHNAHPHLPFSFETTQLPEVRTMRSRTLDSASLHKTLLPHSQMSEGDQDASQRKRKVSIKRKNPEENESDSLQFSFDYSYSSTGSSGENDWVLVEKQTESSWPSEKKACNANHPSVFAHSMQHHYQFDNNSIPPSISSAHMLGVEVAAIDVPIGVTISPFDSLLDTDIELVSRAEDNTPIQHHAMELAMAMDLGRHSEDTEKMEMEVDHTALDYSSNVQMTLAVNNTVTPSPLVLRPHPQYPQASGGGNMHNLLPIPARHSCMEGFLHQQSRSEGGWWCLGKDGGLDADMETRLNLSKSL